MNNIGRTACHICSVIPIAGTVVEFSAFVGCTISGDEEGAKEHLAGGVVSAVCDALCFIPFAGYAAGIGIRSAQTGVAVGGKVGMQWIAKGLAKGIAKKGIVYGTGTATRNAVNGLIG